MLAILTASTTVSHGTVRYGTASTIATTAPNAWVFNNEFKI